MAAFVYVAGKWSDKVAVRRVMAQVRAAGHRITEDWTEHSEGVGKSTDALANDAMHDVQGILAADVILVLLTDPVYPYRGSFFEMGVACGSDKKIFVVAHPDPNAAFRKVAFFHLPEVEVFATVDAAVAAIGPRTSE